MWTGLSCAVAPRSIFAFVDIQSNVRYWPEGAILRVESY